jgi:hypothetical protein
MRYFIFQLLAWLLLGGWQPLDPTSALIAARTRAYDANVRNDAKALAAALDTFAALAREETRAPWPDYYASWTAWSLAASHLQAGDQPAAKRVLEASVRHARRAAALEPASAETHNMLANAMIALAVTDSTQFQALATELVGVRRKALELGPRNPRVVMMDAGMIFNVPKERGGDMQKGIARWLHALELFEAEAATTPVDEREPRWGRDLAYGWLSNLYLRLPEPDTARARQAADRALALRPDFWWVRTVVLPKLTDAR